jgi:ABC-type transport system substrate-binding protein
MVEMDRGKRLEQVREIQRILYDECVSLPLLNVNLVFGVGKKVKWQPLPGYTVLMSSLEYATPIE